MIKAIVYESKAGHTKRYAEMLSDKINVRAMNLKEPKKELDRNDEIVFLGWVCATKIKGLKKQKDITLNALVFLEFIRKKIHILIH